MPLCDALWQPVSPVPTKPEQEERRISPQQHACAAGQWKKARRRGVPEGHAEQVRDPGVLVHVVCRSQKPLLVRHSFTSVQLVSPLPE